MAKTILIDEAVLVDEFENVLDEMYFRYHYHPTNIPHHYISETERSEMSYYDAMGTDLVSDYDPLNNEKSKRVVFHGNSDYCNGLPRRR